MTAPLVTIVMAMRNAEKTLAPCLRSLRNQTRGDWELILLDDGSTDRSQEIASDWGDPRLRQFGDGRNLGLPTRLNQGIDLARGRYIARMDADDIAYPCRLERQAAFLDAHAGVDLVAARAIVFDGTGTATGLFPFPGSDHAAICARPWAGFPFPHPTWMGRMEWFRRHRYRESALKAQDQELLLRSHRDSCFAAIDEILLGYRQGALSPGKSLTARRAYCAALLREVGKGTDWRTALLGLGYHALGMLKDLLLAGRRNALWRPPSALEAARWHGLWQEVSGRSCAE